MYDITRRQSFENLVRWLEELKENGYSKMTIVMVGNKADRDDEYVYCIHYTLIVVKYHLKRDRHLLRRIISCFLKLLLKLISM